MLQRLIRSSSELLNLFSCWDEYMMMNMMQLYSIAVVFYFVGEDLYPSLYH